MIRRGGQKGTHDGVDGRGDTKETETQQRWMVSHKRSPSRERHGVGHGHLQGDEMREKVVENRKGFIRKVFVGKGKRKMFEICEWSEKKDVLICLIVAALECE